MIRTVVIPCKLPTAIADAFNLESGRIYTQVLVQHYRIYRKKGIWLSPGVLEKLSDFLNRDRKPLLHAHSIEREFDITIRRKVTLFKNQLLTNLDHDFVVL